MFQSSYMMWTGGVVIAMVIFSLALLRLIGAAEASQKEPSTKQTSHNPERTLDASSVGELRSTADTFLDTAASAREERKFEEAIEAYTAALTRYQAALNKLNPEASKTHTEIEDTIDSTESELEAVRTLHTQRKNLTETLKSAEQSFQVAIGAHTQGDHTLARIRFRQARDSFADATTQIEDADNNLFSSPIEVSVDPDQKLTSTTLRELQTIPEPVATTLADAGVTTGAELESSNEPPWPPAIIETLSDQHTVDDELQTTLTVLSWMDDSDSRVFDTPTAVSQRREQAAYGFNQS
ncbi:hypothetical protein C464_01541 [Halorubrum coriense DSM 10284]|uniref:Uncharacterized protein n=1 Tax=Halorubrum coriense DSM 10284 TaxID=1227466 RepID=M0EW46_9EURY|nr:hypothetical protein [Halorubrum coriense]ELZ51122.1 hypothetical protein C464_01541 [Halorubrum coriense DSM 10284]